MDQAFISDCNEGDNQVVQVVGYRGDTDQFVKM